MKDLNTVVKVIAGHVERQYLQTIADINNWDIRYSPADRICGYDAIVNDGTIVEFKRRTFDSKRYQTKGVILEYNKIKTLKYWQNKLGYKCTFYIQAFTDNAYYIHLLQDPNFYSFDLLKMNDQTSNNRTDKVEKTVTLLTYSDPELAYVDEWPTFDIEALLNQLHRYYIKKNIENFDLTDALNKIEHIKNNLKL